MKRTACRVCLWNLEWAAPQGRKGRELARRIAAVQADVACLTEAAAGNFPDEGCVISASADYGYPIKDPARRKVLLWSRRPWTDVDALGHPDLPSGRFIAGTTATPIGPLRFIGVCIPWKAAHVRNGRRDRALWQDHGAYLCGLRAFLERQPTVGPCILLGDFNQRVPRGPQPREVFDGLMSALGSNFALATSGPIVGVPGLSIDHLAYMSEVAVSVPRYLDPCDASGAPLTDHFGLAIDIFGVPADPPG